MRDSTAGDAGVRAGRVQSIGSYPPDFRPTDTRPLDTSRRSYTYRPMGNRRMPRDKGTASLGRDETSLGRNETSFSDKSQ